MGRVTFSKEFLDEHPGAHGGRDAVIRAVVVVVEHVHRVTEPDPGVPLLAAVEPVVVVRHPQVPDVGGEAVVVAEQHALGVVGDPVPGDGDEVGLALDVQRAVVAAVEGVVVDPDVTGILHVDRVVVPTPEGEVADDDVGGTADVQAVVQRGVTDAEHGLVGADVVHLVRHGECALHPDDQR
ncbi:hypothetical protein GCM10027614_01860 [Micromonospora vulcania]